MVEINKEVLEIVNKPGRVGVLGTADKQGQPNTAYFGSMRLREDSGRRNRGAESGSTGFRSVGTGFFLFTGAMPASAWPVRRSSAITVNNLIRAIRFPLPSFAF